MNIALIGDHNPEITAHKAIPLAIEIAGSSASMVPKHIWLDTAKIESTDLSIFDGFWGIPGSPYQSFSGALKAIQYAREHQVPFFGSCGGYQHAALEYARNVLDITDAENTEENPDAASPVVSALSCALIEENGAIHFDENSTLNQIYGMGKIFETYHCSFGVNPDYLESFNDSDMCFCGWDDNQEPRAFELKNHPFFIGTAYQPERSALVNLPHPLISRFVEAVATYRANRT